MTSRHRSDRWVPQIGKRTGPAYLAIADALEADVRSGRVKPGEPLPTQRDLARRLGVNFTTVTRAYAEAQRRGLLTATVGRGTFVTDPAARTSDEPAGALQDYNLSVNAPPVPAWLHTALSETLAQLSRDPAISERM